MRKAWVLGLVACASLTALATGAVHDRRDLHRDLSPTPAMHISMRNDLNQPRMTYNPAGVAFAQGLIIGAGTNNWLVAKNFDAETIWALPNKYPLVAPPKIDGKHVYFALQSGEIKKVSLANGKLIWKVQLHGQANKPLVIAASTLLVNTAGKHLYALATTDGKTKWLQDISNTAEVNILGGAPPLIAGDNTTTTKVYSGDANGKIRVLDLDKGTLLHSYDFVQTTKKGELRSIIGQLYLHSLRHNLPTRLFFTAANGMIGNIDLQTNSLLWQQKFPAITTSHCEQDTCHIGLGGGELLALDVHTGEKKWHKVLGWDITTIMMHDKQLYLTGATGNIMRLLPLVGETVWQYNLGTSISVPARIYRNMIFFATGYHNIYGFLL
ncbi:MAG: PQQ-like beta-propeller repeat protein [Pseudomonadota bacterium]|nr:PQQ-like beta-propeller repeat protein [Pseudomonadota bacterium]